MDKYIKAAIIGYHLSGASIEQIIIVVGIPHYLVDVAIQNHLEDRLNIR